jgi:hypothetical protein
MHGAPNYSPFQIMEAGQRAEADNQTHYAVQFYQHLLEHYGETREAQFARKRLSHLGVNAPNGATPMHALAYGDLSHQVRPIAPFNGTHGQQLAVSNTYGAPDTEPAPPSPISHSGDPVTHRSARAARGTTVPAVRGYVVGRVVAWVMTVSGTLTAICAIFAMVAGGAIQFGLLKLTSLGAFALLVPMSGYGVITGLTLVFLGQFARASFDTADATQELVAMARLSGSASKRH